MTRLIFLEDESILRENIAGFLTESGFAVDAVGDLAEFDKTFLPGTHLIAILDLGLPDGDGLALIARLRAQGERLGIIILTAQGGSANKVHGLTTGADHYLLKPFDLVELAAIIGALARRLQEGGAKLEWALDASQRQLIPPGKAPIGLTAQAYSVLKAIADGHGAPVDRRRIVEALGEDYLDYDMRRLDTQIYQLRKTVLAASGIDLPVSTARGQGYQFTAAINVPA